ncbi:unnamed protein product [Ilex paraguariensis]|uniref:C2H2-type domain-containing protein n=1 Tax=Ilex paraguariensis TaxID=185542 RepID=A0ABC8QYV2_9AQUA
MRARDIEIDNLNTMANYLMLLSQGGEFQTVNNYPRRVFECKTCNRQFTSFQALGGHRASHKKPRLMEDLNQQTDQSETSPPKPKTHECSICGLEFSIGQALGGHMRRHRAATVNENQLPPLSLSPPPAPVVKKSNSRRVLCLDLNLTPMENDLEFGIGKVAPRLIAFYD